MGKPGCHTGSAIEVPSTLVRQRGIWVPRRERGTLINMIQQPQPDWLKLAAARWPGDSISATGRWATVLHCVRRVELDYWYMTAVMVNKGDCCDHGCYRNHEV